MLYEGSIEFPVSDYVKAIEAMTKGQPGEGFVHEQLERWARIGLNKAM